VWRSYGKIPRSSILCGDDDFIVYGLGRDTRLDAIGARLNPHFLFNAVHTLATLVTEKITPLKRQLHLC
jgi:hypothetical protein